MNTKKCFNCQGDSEIETSRGAHGLVRCPEHNVTMERDVNAASNLATLTKHEHEGKPAPV
jgi:transposase